MKNITASPQENIHYITLPTSKNIKIWQTLTGQASPNTTSLYGDLNLGLHVQDKPNEVHHNRARLLTNIQAKHPNIQQIHWLNQIHGDRVVDIDNLPLSVLPIAADAHITSDTTMALAIMTADCVPVMISAENSQVIGGVHAGWQGLAKGIIPKTINSMKQKIHGKNTGNWQAWIGACIARDHYEVDERVKNQVVNQLEQQLAQTNRTLSEPEKNHFFTPQPQKSGHYLADLPAITQFQLELCGLKPENIYLSKLDSYGDKRFYSYRHQSENNLPFTGRMATVIFKA